jgi:regulator of replication initiation timing
MLAKSALATRELDGVDLQPIDRLEEKVRMLVDMIDRLRADNARAAQDNERLANELNGFRARLADAEGTNVELKSLREERDVIRTRVNEMLQQIDSLNL